MSWFRLMVFFASSFSLASSTTVNAQMLQHSRSESACVPVQCYPSIAHYSASTPCETMVVQNPCEVPFSCYSVCAPETYTSCSSTETYTVTVPYTVQQTQTYTVSDPSGQLKEDIKRVKERLDNIQVGPDPSLKKLQDDLKEIKDLLKKTPTPTSKVRDRVDNCERLIAALVKREYREWLDAAEQRRVQAKLISHDSKRVVLERADGKVFRVELEKLSKSDQEFALAIH